MFTLENKLLSIEINKEESLKKNCEKKFLKHFNDVVKKIFFRVNLIHLIQGSEYFQRRLGKIR